jgi:magnesium and cobalt transporter
MKWAMYPKRVSDTRWPGLNFVVLHTKGGAVKWFKVSPAADVAA